MFLHAPVIRYIIGFGKRKFAFDMTETSQTKSHSCQSTLKSVYSGGKNPLPIIRAFFSSSLELRVQNTGLSAGLLLTVY